MERERTRRGREGVGGGVCSTCERGQGGRVVCINIIYRTKWHGVHIFRLIYVAGHRYCVAVTS
jgi:hypothetical protein